MPLSTPRLLRLPCRLMRLGIPPLRRRRPPSPPLPRIAGCAEEDPVAAGAAGAGAGAYDDGRWLSSLPPSSELAESEKCPLSIAAAGLEGKGAAAAGAARDLPAISICRPGSVHNDNIMRRMNLQHNRALRGCLRVLVWDRLLVARWLFLRPY